MNTGSIQEEVVVPGSQTAGIDNGLPLPQKEPASTQYPSLMKAFAQANLSLQGQESLSSKLTAAIQAFANVDRSELPSGLHEELAQALGAMERAANGDLSGVATQYLKLVKTKLGDATSHRVYFTIWNRLEEQKEPCILLCRMNTRILELLQVSRSRAFVECLAARLGAKSYPEAVLLSRLQGVDVIANAGKAPHVLFADFLEMGPDSGIDPSTAGGLLFGSFGDLFLEYMPLVERTFPNVADWLAKNSFLNQESIRFLTTAHVQAHDLCGHSVPYSLVNPTRQKADPFLRGHLEELYADAQAGWTCTASQPRSFFAGVLSEKELDAIPVINTMKNLTYYGTKPASDHDARCAWIMFGYFRKAGLIRRLKNNPNELFFDIDRLPQVFNQLLSDLLQVENAIGQGVDAYESACRQFNQRFGYENPVTGNWEVPDELGNLLAA